MIIKYKNEGYVAESDKFIGVESCCPKMMAAMMSNQQIKVSDRGYVSLLPSNKEIGFCPFCGGAIKREKI